VPKQHSGFAGSHKVPQLPIAPMNCVGLERGHEVIFDDSCHQPANHGRVNDSGMVQPVDHYAMQCEPPALSGCDGDHGGGAFYSEACMDASGVADGEVVKKKRSSLKKFMSKLKFSTKDKSVTVPLPSSNNRF
jgi:hypothetical protein